MKSILVCPIAFNEDVKLGKTLERTADCPDRHRFDCMVVDDGSSDSTDTVLAVHKGVAVIHHDKRMGVGAAIRTAIGYAIQKKYKILVIMAGNNKDNPDHIIRLIKPILNDNYDFVQGSRYLKPEEKNNNFPIQRKLATKYLHPALMSFFLQKRLTDTTNGFRAFKLDIFKDPNINIYQKWLDGYELEPYLLYKVNKLGYKFKEVAVTKIYPQKKNFTKMRPVLGWWSIVRPVVFLGLGLKK